MSALTFPSLARLPVTLAGEWATGTRRRWDGMVTASEPLVGVVFVTKGACTSWCKSTPADPAGLAVFLMLGSHEDSGRDVQVNVGAGHGSAVSRTLVESAAYRPAIDVSGPIVTGTSFVLATVAGNWPVVASVLLLAASDVKVGRHRLWRVRPEPSAALPEPYRRLLTRGRSGEMSA